MGTQDIFFTHNYGADAVNLSKASIQHHHIRTVIFEAVYIRFHPYGIAGNIQRFLVSVLKGVSLDIENYCTLRLIFNLSSPFTCV